MKKTDGKYLGQRKSEYPAQQPTRMIEALYMAGVIDDVDEATCRHWRARFKGNGRNRKLADGSYQIIKDAL